MPKNIEDIIPNNRRSIKSIPIPIRKTSSREAAPEKISHISIERLKSEVRAETVDEPKLEPRLDRRSVERDEQMPRQRRKLHNKHVWVGTVLGLLVIALAVFSLRSSATLAYTPKTTNLSFNADTYVAYQSADPGQLAYSIVKLSGEKSIEVPASGEEAASEKATGSIIVYNTQAVSQRLVKTTRFETPEGLIFRTPTDILIPAKGNVEVTVIAAEPGTSYNIGLSDFTLPGLKGTANFDKVYARSKTPMAGGFVGTRKKVSDADLAAAKTKLQSDLEDSLLSQARVQVPAEFVLFPKLTTVAYTLLPQGASTSSVATVRERGDLIAVIFKRADFAQYIALQKLGANRVGSEVEIPDFAKLGASLFGTPPADLSKVTAIRFQLDGSATLRFVTDEEALKSDLIGKDEKNIPDIIKSYPSIEKASSIVRPFWKSSFPNDVSKIKIERQS
ncbi:baseplate J/gp47 family protein [Candidatus Parcubacteria bacterium]|nr:baseplate J/gp47 family protein [Candidatus Parcubacteria bacterium]